MTNKPTKKRPTYNEEILKRLKEKYGVSRRFITMSLTGERVSETSEKIKEDHKKMVKAVQEAIKNI